MFNWLKKKKSTSVNEVPPALEEDADHAGSDGAQPLIRLRKLVKTFKTPAGDFTVLKGVNADFYQGEFIGVIGKSGSGKTTLINMITGIDRPTSGGIFVAGTPVHTLSENDMATWRGRNLGIVFQFFQLLPTLTLLENLMLPMDFCHLYTPKQRKQRAFELLEQVEMQDHAYKLPTAISGGQQQRVAIARALANDPPILIADEPTGNLDSRTADAVFNLFEDLVAQGKTIVMVTHDIALAKRVSRTLLVADGEVVNEWVARALPTLSHQQMLEATHGLEPVQYSPGQDIISQGKPGEHFYIITRGEVEVFLKSKDGSEVYVSRMGEGQFFGEIEAFRGGQSIATIRAAHQAVEAVALDYDKLLAILSQSESTQSALERLVQQREAENREARKKL